MEGWGRRVGGKNERIVDLNLSVITVRSSRHKMGLLYLYLFYWRRGTQEYSCRPDITRAKYKLLRLITKNRCIDNISSFTNSKKKHFLYKLSVKVL